MVGIRLPLAWQQSEFLWDVGAGATYDPASWGLHCVCAAGYDATYVYVVTWGAIAKVTWAAWDAYVDEVYAIVSTEWLNASGASPAGLTLAQLVSDLPANIQAGPGSPIVNFLNGNVAPESGVGALITPQVMVSNAGLLTDTLTNVTLPSGGFISNNVAQSWSGSVLSAAYLPNPISSPGYAGITGGWTPGAAMLASYVIPPAGSSTTSPEWQDVTVASNMVVTPASAGPGLLLNDGLLDFSIVGTASGATATSVPWSDIWALEAWMATVTGMAPAVRRLYLGIFKRNPTNEEVAYYNTAYLQGQAGQDANPTPMGTLFATPIVQWFLGSGEFTDISKGWTVQQLIQWLYESALLRDPAPSELSFYANSGASWAVIATFITQSQEAVSKLGYA